MITSVVTGGAGFLGSHLCDALLARGDRVVCVDDLSTGSITNVTHLLGLPAFTLIRQDVVDPLVLHADRIFHLACPASPIHYQRDPVRTIRTAVEGTRHALDLARRTSARLLIASTSEVYGDPEEHPQRESYWGKVNPIGPRACYDEGKRCAEALAIAYQQHGVDTRIARIFNTYGPRIRPDDGRVVSTFIAQALADEEITIFGDGSQTRSFCYVDDLIVGLVALMEHKDNLGPVNLGNPHEVSVAELARLVIDICGGGRVTQRPLPVDDPTRRRPDITRATTHLGWSPHVPLTEGLVRTVADLRPRLASAARGAS